MSPKRGMRGEKCEPLSVQKSFASCGGHFRGTATKVGILVFFLDSCLRRKDTVAPSPGGALGTAGLSRGGRGPWFHSAKMVGKR